MSEDDKELNKNFDELLAYEEKKELSTQTPDKLRKLESAACTTVGKKMSNEWSNYRSSE